MKRRLKSFPPGTKIEHDEDGWWAYYPPGYKSAADPMGALHQDHEDSRPELVIVARMALPCGCSEECRKVSGVKV